MFLSTSRTSCPAPTRGDLLLKEARHARQLFNDGGSDVVINDRAACSVGLDHVLVERDCCDQLQLVVLTVRPDRLFVSRCAKLIRDAVDSGYAEPPRKGHDTPGSLKRAVVRLDNYEQGV